MTTRHYARLVASWIASVGLDPHIFATHSLRRTKPMLIYRRTGNLRAVQLLLGHRKIESTSGISGSRSMTRSQYQSRWTSKLEGQSRRALRHSDFGSSEKEPGDSRPAGQVSGHLGHSARPCTRRDGRFVPQADVSGRPGPARSSTARDRLGTNIVNC